MIKLFWPGIVLLLMLTGCGSGGTPTRQNDFVPLTSIGITAVYPAIAEGTSTKITATGNYSGLFTRDITSQVVWTSSNPIVADFITAGSPDRVTGRHPGVATLTATMGDVTASYNLTVTTATIAEMTITPASPPVDAGKTIQFQVTGKFSDSTNQDLTFDAAWTSSDENVATVSNTPASKGLAKAVAVGTAIITATFKDKSATTPMAVTVPVLQSITITPANPSVLSLSTKNFTAKGTYSDGSTPDITAKVTWSSSQPAFATIDASGLAKTLSKGTTSIIAKLDGISGATNLKVTGGNLTAITLDPATLNMAQGTQSQISAIGKFDNGASREITGVVSWSVANTTSASVTNKGGNLAIIDALSSTAIPTTVSAQSGSVTSLAASNLTIVNTTLNANGLTFPAGLNLNLTVGASSRFTVSGSFSGLNEVMTTSATWSSSNETAAKVGNTSGDTALSKGWVTGAAAGAATISAAFGAQSVPVNVTVIQRTLQSLSISPGPTTSVTSGNQSGFTATAIYTDGTNLDVTADAVWKTNDANVAILADSINQPGQVVGIDTGTTTLTATFGNLSQSVTLTVP